MRGQFFSDYASLKVSKKVIFHTWPMRSLKFTTVDALTDLSPYTLCLFRLGLAPGVLSLTRPASSISFSALLRAVGSTGSDPTLSALFAIWPLVLLRLVASGGVFISGETKFGVCDLSMVTMEEVMYGWI